MALFFKWRVLYAFSFSWKIIVSRKWTWKLLFCCYSYKISRGFNSQFGQLSSALVLFGAWPLPSDSLIRHSQIGNCSSHWRSTPPCWHGPPRKCLKWKWLRKDSNYSCKAGLEWRRHASHSFGKCLLGTNYAPGMLLGSQTNKTGKKAFSHGAYLPQYETKDIQVPGGSDRRENEWCPMSNSMKPRRCSSLFIAPQPIDMHRPRLDHVGTGY